MATIEQLIEGASAEELIDYLIGRAMAIGRARLNTRAAAAQCAPIKADLLALISPKRRAIEITDDLIEHCGKALYTGQGLFPTPWDLAFDERKEFYREEVTKVLKIIIAALDAEPARPAEGSTA